MAIRTRERRQSQRAIDAQFAAIAANLEVPDERDMILTVARASSRQAKTAWDNYKRIGEVRYAIDRSARIAGYATLHARKKQANGKYKICTPGTRRSDSWDQKAAQIVEDIYSPFGGVRGLIDRYYSLRKISGDMFLVRYVDKGNFDGYCFLSPEEIDQQTGAGRDVRTDVKWIMSSAKSGDTTLLTRTVFARDFLGRVWAPSKQYHMDSTSPLSALETECEVLWSLTQSMKARIRSRFALAGILGLPSEIQSAKRRVNGKLVPIDDIATYLIEAMTAAVDDISDASAVVPIILQASGDALEKIQKIDWDRTIDQSDLKLRAELIDRILSGLDSSKDTAKGIGDQNHWSAWSASDDERRTAVDPDLDELDWTFTRLILHAELLEMGCPPDQVLQYSVGHDMSNAAVKTNIAEDVRTAYDVGVANPAAVARVTGLGEDDCLDPMSNEYARWAGRITKNPKLLMAGTPYFDDIPWDTPGTPGPAPDSDRDDPNSGPGVGEPGSPNDQKRSTSRKDRPA